MKFSDDKEHVPKSWVTQKSLFYAFISDCIYYIFVDEDTFFFTGQKTCQGYGFLRQYQFPDFKQKTWNKN